MQKSVKLTKSKRDDQVGGDLNDSADADKGR